MKNTLPLFYLLLSVYFTSFAQISHIQGPQGTEVFGQSVVCFSNGNFAVSDPLFDDNGKKDVGAVFIFDGKTHEIIATLKGKYPNDRIGSNINLLTDDWLVVNSPFWNEDKGALTLLRNKTNEPIILDESNSLVGTERLDLSLVSLQIQADKSSYVLMIQSWNRNRGAVIAKNINEPLTGTITKENAFVGSNENDRVGQGVLILNNKKIVIATSRYDQNRGAVTVKDFATCKGEITASNSLIGEMQGDLVGVRVTPLKDNSSFVVNSYNWNGGRGAVTYMNSQSPVIALINSSNSLIGERNTDNLGINGVHALSNHNYVIVTTSWNERRGAVTFGDGSKGIVGTVNSNNSLVGSRTNDQVGSGFLELTNGNFVVNSPFWNEQRGAVTWSDGLKGSHGTIDENNSLIGEMPKDFVGKKVDFLTDGNYVIISDEIKKFKGAVTFGNGTSGTKGKVTKENSLVGGVAENDFVNSPQITRLPDGNWIVNSVGWINYRGAITYMASDKPTTGDISVQNSVVGSVDFDKIGVGGVISLGNGNYVFSSPSWNKEKGAVTWGKGKLTGEVSVQNSLVGIRTHPRSNAPTMMALTNGNYIAYTHSLYEGNGVVVWGNGTTGTFGEVNASNSLSGDNHHIISVSPLVNGNFVINSAKKLVEYNAITWADGKTPLKGNISKENSLISLYDGVGLGNERSPIIPLKTGDYLVYNMYGNKGNGLVTWADGTKGLVGEPTDKNSIQGVSFLDATNMLPVYNFVLKYLLVGRPRNNTVSVFNHNFEVITGIEEQLTQGEHTTLFPNPAREHTSLKLNRGDSESVMVKIMDHKGQNVAWQSGTLSRNSSMELSIQSLPAGLYVLEIVGSTFIERKKLVKN